MEFKDYYKTLGIARDASSDEIKKAYRRLARKYHPDVSKEKDAAARMAEVNEANAVLGDPEKRAAYDALASGGRPAGSGSFTPPPNWDAAYEFSGAPDGRGGMDEAQFSDFFEQLFGRDARARHAGPQGQHASGPQRGADHHARIELELRDAYQGGERLLTLQGARLDAQGHLVREERQVQVKIPKGVREGQLIRLSGQGGAGLAGGGAGDLFLEVVFKPDARWRTQDRDVYQNVPVTPWEAELGGPIEVQTPGGATVEVTVPPHFTPGRKLRLKERGIPAATPGDLYLELQVAWPPATSEAQKQAYRTLAQAFPAFAPRHAQGV